jgi:hypothetical protein
LDFNRLLSLGGPAGLGESTGFQRRMADLAKVRAFGARTTSNASTSTAEISVLTTP